MGKNILALAGVLALAIMASAGENIVAVVNGVPITDREVNDAVGQLIPRSTFHGSVSDESKAEFREKALENLITYELQYQDGVARGIAAEKSQVKEQMKLVRGSFASTKDYKNWLEQASLTEDQLREKLRKGLVVQAVVTKMVVEPSRMDDKALQEYYTKNTAKFRQPEGVRLRIISTKNEKKAKDILAKLKGGDDFGDVAARMSEDDFRIKGGDIGYIHRGRIYPALEEAAFKLKPGEISGLIWTEETWFVVKVEDRRPEQVVPFEKAKDRLRTELEKKRASELMEAWVSGLRGKAKIEVRNPPQ
jgi:peptidyl-prolyl cis-trans isomerase C